MTPDQITQQIKKRRRNVHIGFMTSILLWAMAILLYKVNPNSFTGFTLIVFAVVLGSCIGNLLATEKRWKEHKKFIRDRQRGTAKTVNKVLEDMKKDIGKNKQIIVCPKCGIYLPNIDKSCWNCGHEFKKDNSSS